MAIKLVIEGELPSMNQLINANKYSRYSGGALKNAWTARTGLAIKKQLGDQKLEGLYWFDFTWYRTSKRTDPDNIAGAGMKFIFDGCQKFNIMKNDGWKQVAGFSHSFKVDKENPRVEIEVKEVL